MRIVKVPEDRFEILDLLPPGPVMGVEVGTDCGIYASELLRLRPDLFLWTVDPWETYHEFTEPGRITALRFYRERVGPFVEQGRTKHLRMHSTDAAWELADRYGAAFLDFVYIDGEHSERAVREDLEAWYPLLKAGGLMAGHDGEAAAVHTPAIQFAKKHRLDLCWINEHGGPDQGDTLGSGFDSWGGWAHPTFFFFKQSRSAVAPVRRGF